MCAGKKGENGTNAHLRPRQVAVRRRGEGLGRRSGRGFTKEKKKGFEFTVDHALYKLTVSFGWRACPKWLLLDRVTSPVTDTQSYHISKQ